MTRSLRSRLTATRLKLAFARTSRWILRLFLRKPRYTIRRRGIAYEVDLDDGIDLSLFLFGSFQQHVFARLEGLLPEDGAVVDVGANVGAMALQFARMVPSGVVYAIEPTHHAFEKLARNAELNPEVATRIVAMQILLSSAATDTPNIKTYSSWRIGGEPDVDSHAVHGGTAGSSEGVQCTTLDALVEEGEIERIDLLKIDTDGHELDILMGARSAIARFRPTVIFEVGHYLLEERGQRFEQFIEYFDEHRYALRHSGNQKLLDRTNFDEHLPRKGTIDVIGEPG